MVKYEHCGIRPSKRKQCPITAGLERYGKCVARPERRLCHPARSDQEIGPLHELWRAGCGWQLCHPVDQLVQLDRAGEFSARNPRPEEVEQLKGRYIFGGVLYGHFGHFIVESLARLWAQDAEGVDAEAYIFTAKVSTFPQKSVEKLQKLAALLGLRLPIIVARVPTQVETLYVPAQGFGMNDLIEGSAAFRTFMNTHAGAGIEPTGDEKIYISRSKLPSDRGSLLGEYKLEEYLAAEGYDIFHPQRFPAEEQIARYKAARQIIAVDCSPLHMLGYVGHKDQSAAIILRRSMVIGDYLARQLQSFKGMDAYSIDCLLDDWILQPGSRPSRSSWGEIDFGALHAKLLASGHIQNPTPWPSLTQEERSAELERIEKMHEAKFRSYNEIKVIRNKSII
ncbi:glycosyltransferase 61 family protein [Ketogulonicigenium vulgare]|uniref:glycosyltransferase 61 family protein n=1 Tax=Ketogulonicigenium vulgare TaxID=92945 RepID=UPI0020C7C3A5|nr:glycosyltransferase 61 family protein [Ketogulonicigenium vulgare]